MISYLGSLVQFSPAAGRAGLCRQMSLCVGSTRCVLARQPEVLRASPWVRRAFSPAAVSPGSQSFGRPLPGCCVPFPSVASGSGGQRFACSLSGWGVPFPSAVSGPGSQGFGALSPGVVRLFPPRRVARAARGLAPFPSAASGPGSQRFGALSTGAPCLFPPRPQRALPVGSQEVFR